MFNIPFLSKRVSVPTGIEINDRKIKLIVGLGNPSEKYRDTYHNIGSGFLDSLADGDEQDWKTAKSFEYKKIGGVVLAKPKVFMNNSGGSLKEMLRYFDIEPEKLLVAHDDADIGVGKYKFSFGKGSAGHNGIKSIIKSLKTDRFLRLRIGVSYKNQKSGDFVLKKVKGGHAEILEKLFGKVKADHFKF